MTELTPAVALAIAGSGIFFLAGLWIGVWKYIAMMRSENHQAPIYVDIAHRASLMYSFAALVLARFAEFDLWGDLVTSLAVGVPLLCFGSAVSNYLWLAWRGADNQFRRRTFITTWGMGLLIVGEIGGFSVLLLGFGLS